MNCYTVMPLVRTVFGLPIVRILILPTPESRAGVTAKLPPVKPVGSARVSNP